MDNQNPLKKIRAIIRSLQWVTGLVIIILSLTVGIGLFPEYFTRIIKGQNSEEKVNSESLELKSDETSIENGVHLPTGFIVDEGYEQVVSTCTACHSAKLVTQNRATREGWISMIRWMQATQNLWDLGENEEVIVRYLAKNYAPVKIGRRKKLENIEWYELNDSSR